MKRLLSISLIFLLAIVITYAGSGINAYSFCCEDCHTFGIEAIVGEKCGDIHEDECSSDQDVSDKINCESSHDQCLLERLDMDLQDISTAKSQTDLSTKILGVYLATLHNNLIQKNQVETIKGYISQTQKPPNLSNLVYFSLLETLII